MTNATYAPRAASLFSSKNGLIAELFAATPLAIFLSALGK